MVNKNIFGSNIDTFEIMAHYKQDVSTSSEPLSIKRDFKMTKISYRSNVSFIMYCTF